jgi:hypothetical protein
MTKVGEREVDKLEKLIEIREIIGTSYLHERLEMEDKLEGIWEPKVIALLPILESISPSPPLGKPLRVCILTIMWSMNSSMISPISISKELLSLLSSAARYQITSPGVSSHRLFPTIIRSLNIKQDELIAQSLICLRTSLETRRTQRYRHFSKNHHEACTPTLCMVECSANLTLHLKSYLDEFSRVIFRKENLQSNRAWWLSAFYSLCIQDIVRKLLVDIVRKLSYECGEGDALAPKRYLHLAVKLFLASSGGYDPVMTNYDSGESVRAAETHHFKLAQYAVGQSSWADRDIYSSRDYLCGLFDVDETSDSSPNTEESESEDLMADPWYFPG